MDPQEGPLLTNQVKSLQCKSGTIATPKINKKKMYQNINKKCQLWTIFISIFKWKKKTKT